MASPRNLELFYDVLSPYSWIGFEVLLRYRPIWNINLNLQPFSIAFIMKASGNSPPGLIPAKGEYMLKDLKRSFQYYNLPKFVPMKDPVNVMMVKGSISAMRLLTASKMYRGEEDLIALSRELWKRLHMKDEDIASPESLVEVCKKAGLGAADANKLLEQSQTDVVKAKLKETTDRASEYGSFGTPTMLVEDADGEKQMFFGSDRFHLIADVLGVEWKGPLIPTTSKL